MVVTEKFADIPREKNIFLYHEIRQKFKKAVKAMKTDTPINTHIPCYNICGQSKDIYILKS